MGKNILRLRPHHIMDIYAYYMRGSKKEFEQSRKYDRIKSGDSFIDNTIYLMEKFWNGYFTKLEVVLTDDDYCKLCKVSDCEVRTEPENWRDDEIRNFGFGPGLYDAEEIKEKIRQEGKPTRRKDLPEM